MRFLIEAALKASGWNIASRREVQIELRKAPEGLDYLLHDAAGRVLCVLEGKADPGAAPGIERAACYAMKLDAPFVTTSNGQEHWFRTVRAPYRNDPIPVARLPSRDDLERLHLKSLRPPRPLQSEKSSQLTRRGRPVLLAHRDVQAIAEIALRFDAKRHRDFALRAPSAPGKSLLYAALIHCFLATRNAERVLLVTEHMEPARRALEEMNIFPGLRIEPLPGPRPSGGDATVCVADRRSLVENRRYCLEFTPFHFDLVIACHESASCPAETENVVRYFQAARIRLAGASYAAS
ncbi:MAG: hypothetical protein A3G80_05640 [Betaproteobacteria bacterium RIFCSPLOWO2_12_FULL_62_13b]|nr:MAG: hypothetical protein A3G80_05640 [Betaproteobacteria bacterium RIFCSPLOWO2_12_FULL_62_13b]